MRLAHTAGDSRDTRESVGHAWSAPLAWAVGCVVWEMVTLRPLFVGSSDLDQLAKLIGALGVPTAATWPPGARPRPPTRAQDSARRSLPLAVARAGVQAAAHSRGRDQGLFQLPHLPQGPGPQHSAVAACTHAWRRQPHRPCRMPHMRHPTQKRLSEALRAVQLRYSLLLIRITISHSQRA